MLRREKRLERKIAKERISILLNMADKMKFEDYALARRYVELAKKIAMRYRIRISKDQKRNFCKKCLYPYRHDRVRVRVRKSRVMITCLNCGFIRRIPIRPIKSSQSKKINEVNKK
jgi:ribonuclease P protein subunit RPR2